MYVYVWVCVCYSVCMHACRYCPKCKEHREAIKQMSLWRLPKILIIQLKRFTYQKCIWKDKIDKDVSFPLKLVQYVCSFIPYKSETNTNFYGSNSLNAKLNK